MEVSTSPFRCWCSGILNYSLGQIQASHSSTSCVVKGSICPEFLPSSDFTVGISVSLGHVKPVLCASFGGPCSAVDEDFVLWHMTLRHEWAVLNITKEPAAATAAAASSSSSSSTSSSCHRPFLPGTSLEPSVIPTAQPSIFTLLYFLYYV